MLSVAEPKMIANETVLGLDSAKNLFNGAGMSTTDNQGNKKSIPPAPQVEKINSRFGEIKVDMAKAILFPVGILGMPDKHHFVLTDFPNTKLAQFKLLQSLDDESLSFITLPIEMENNIIAAEDILAASKDMEIPAKDLGMVLIVSVHRGLTSVQLSVNARAPIFFDAERRAAAQYVFTSSKYKIQHFITGEPEPTAESA